MSSYSGDRYAGGGMFGASVRARGSTDELQLCEQARCGGRAVWRPVIQNPELLDRVFAGFRLEETLRLMGGDHPIRNDLVSQRGIRADRLVSTNRVPRLLILEFRGGTRFSGRIGAQQD